MFFEATVNNLENHQALKDILINNKLLVLNRGAEVGVRYGSLTHALLQAIPNLSLIAVDPYAPYQDVHDFFTQEMQNKIKANAAMKLAEYYSRVTWIYEMSSLAANKVGARSLDFVFIDAEHTFSAVTTDCRVWLIRYALEVSYVGTIITWQL